MTQNFNVRPDTNIPVVLAYNMSHYESMEPCTDDDTHSSVALVNEYLEGRYRYSKEDLPNLISMQIEKQQDNNYIQLRNKQKMERNERKEQKSDDKMVKVPGRKDHGAFHHADVLSVYDRGLYSLVPMHSDDPSTRRTLQSGT